MPNIVVSVWDDLYPGDNEEDQNLLHIQGTASYEGASNVERVSWKIPVPWGISENAFNKKCLRAGIKALEASGVSVNQGDIKMVFGGAVRF